VTRHASLAGAACSFLFISDPVCAPLSASS